MNETIEEGDSKFEELENIDSVEGLILALGNEYFCTNYNIQAEDATKMAEQIKSSLDLMGVGNNESGEIKYLGLNFFDSEYHNILNKGNDLIEALAKKQGEDYPKKRLIMVINPPAV